MKHTYAVLLLCLCAGSSHTFAQTYLGADRQLVDTEAAAHWKKEVVDAKDGSRRVQTYTRNKKGKWEKLSGYVSYAPIDDTTLKVHYYDRSLRNEVVRRYYRPLPDGRYAFRDESWGGYPIQSGKALEMVPLLLTDTLLTYNDDGTVKWQQIYVRNAPFFEYLYHQVLSRKPTTPKGVEANPDVPSKLPADFIAYLSHTKRYPKEAVRKRKEGTVKIECVVEPDGALTPYAFKEKVPLLNRAALLTVLQYPGAFVPATKDGRLVRSTITVSVPFYFGKGNAYARRDMLQEAELIPEEIFDQQPTEVVYLNKVNAVTSHPDSAFRVVELYLTDSSTYQLSRLASDSNLLFDCYQIDLLREGTYQVKNVGETGITGRVFTKNPDGTYHFREYDLQNRKIREGIASRTVPLLLHGPVAEYYPDGSKKRQAHYARNEMLRNRNWREDGTESVPDVFRYCTQKASFEPGWEVYRKHFRRFFISGNTNGMSVGGFTKLKVLVMEDGAVGDVTVVRSINSKATALCLEAVRKLPNRWVPAQKHGRPVRSQFYLTFFYDGLHIVPVGPVINGYL